MGDEYKDPDAPITDWLKSWGSMIVGAAALIYAVFGFVTRSITAATRMGSVVLANDDARFYSILIGFVGIVFFVLGARRWLS